MSKFKAPSNIKQIGNIDEKIKIYIEDYVYTYLQQYATAGDYNERLAFLIGKNINDENKNIILISGAVSGKYTQHGDGILNITKETWSYVYEQIQKYFKGLEVVGLMQSQPGYGTYLNNKYVCQFRNNFNKLFQTFLVCDPIENLNVFHVFDSVRENLNPIKGYFIYYQKNESMSEYMIANRDARQKPNPEHESSKKDDENQKSNNKKRNEEETLESVIRNKQSERTKIFNGDQKKIVNMLAGLSAILFIICFVMGTGLVQNEERITKLETQFQTLNDSYENKKNQEDKTASVFHAQENSVQPTNTTGQVTPKNFSDTIKVDLTPEIQDKITDDTEISQINKNSAKENNEGEKDKEKEDSEPNNQVQKTYTVQSGDSLSSISRKFFGNTSMVKKIMELNNMDNADTIYAGKILKLP